MSSRAFSLVWYGTMFVGNAGCMWYWAGRGRWGWFAFSAVSGAMCAAKWAKAFVGREEGR